MLRELSRSYLTIVKDLSRVMNRLKAVYRSWAIPCPWIGFALFDLSRLHLLLVATTPIGFRNYASPAPVSPW